MIWTGDNIDEVRAVYPAAFRFRHHGYETVRLVLGDRMFMPGERIPR